MSHTGHAPFGFDWKGGDLIVVEEEARIRRLAFELYAEHRNKSAVAKRLNELGHKTRRGNGWRDVTVARLLSCSSANGLYTINKTALNSGGERIEKPQDEWKFIECPSIVSPELWERVRAALADEAPVLPAAGTPTHAFTSILFCGCGARMNVATSSQKYVCIRCGNRIPIPDLENAFLDEVTSFLHKRRSTAAAIISGGPDLASQRQLLQLTQDNARKIDGEIAKAERLFMDSRISLERFEKLHRPLEKERATVQRELGKIKARLTRLKATQPKEPDQTPFDPTMLRNGWPKLSPNTRRSIARSFVERIVVNGDEIEFSYKFRDPPERPAKDQHSPAPTNADSSSESGDGEPLYIRLPKPRQRCPRTGMTRSALNELILPTEKNSYRPPVESKCLRKREGEKGTRLIVWQSLKEYLAQQQ
ncbi:MAG: recombinase family protein [Chthoniobacteraceae bacterium]